MRELLFLMVIAGELGIAASPAPAGEAPKCALDASAAVIKVADQPSAASTETAASPAQAVAAPAERGVEGGVLSAPDGAEKISVLKHIIGTGAKLLDLGSTHGLKSVVARNGEQFMVLQIAPDGEAVVSGPQLDLSVSTLLTIAGGQVRELGEKHGLRGFYLQNGPEFQVLYATPDGQATIAGVMWDSSGKNLTREQVAPIAGALPTVVVGKDAGAGNAADGQAATKPALEAAEKTAFGTMGNEGAPRLWLFVDPLCSYSVRALQELKPLVDQGRVQLAIIPVSVLDYEDQNQSTPAALALLSKDPAALAAAWEHREYRGAQAPEATERLRKNMAASQDIGLSGTPTVVWRKADGTEGRVDGLPNDWSAVISSLGGDNHVAASR
jgi:thiol:disulfide interchange protein DsbG